MFKIGDFSKFTRVSVKMLRHYDEIGLLKPAHIDPFTNYRYYSADQLPRLNRIIAFKDLGFSLEQIGQMLDEELSADEIRGMLKLRRTEIKQRLRDEEARLARIETRLQQMDLEERSSAGHLSAYDVVVRAVEPELIAGIRTCVATAGNGVAPLFDEVEAYAARHKARAARPPLMIYHDAEYHEREIEIEVAVPLTDLIPGSDRVGVRELAGVKTMACIIHTGSYANMQRAFYALLNWIEANAYEIDGPMRELFLRFGADPKAYTLPEVYLAADASEFVTELQIPVKKEMA